MSSRIHAPALALAGALACLPAHSSSRISPPEPSEFDLVNLRMTVDSCAFAPETVSVSSSGGTIRVAHRPRQCLLPGEPRIVDIRLGALPIGDWRVEVHPDGDPAGPVEERIDFSVRGRPQIAVFPPPPRPLTDYSGQWYRPTEAGWGLSVDQSPTNVVFAAWYVYDADGTPAWYLIQDGQWTTPTRWTGKVYRTFGPPYFPGPGFDPARVVLAVVGEAALEFQQTPGEEGIATFSYQVNGQAGSKRITRLLF
jgi:hypothetical protein